MYAGHYIEHPGLVEKPVEGLQFLHLRVDFVPGCICFVERVASEHGFVGTSVELDMRIQHFKHISQKHFAVMSGYCLLDKQVSVFCIALT